MIAQPMLPTPQQDARTYAEAVADLAAILERLDRLDPRHERHHHAITPAASTGIQPAGTEV